MIRLPAPRYIDTPSGLREWVARLEDARVIGVDTESDSFFHYREKVCLIQMTVDSEDVLIDPLALTDISSLGPIFADPRRVKIFHDAIYDLVCLRRDFDFEFAGIFDTMLASRLLGETAFGLAAVLNQRFGVTPDKRYQRSNWAKRPLSPEQMTYAQMDTHFLPQLRTELTRELEAAGRTQWADEEFARLPKIAAEIPVRAAEPDPDAFWRLKGVKALSAEARGRAKALFMTRERLAERLDRPPFKVFGNGVLVELAKKNPQSFAELGPRPGLGRPAMDRFGRHILAALKKAQPIRGEPPPGSGRRRRSGRSLDPEARERYEVLRRIRREQAESLGLEPEVLLGNAALEAIARKPPKSERALEERHPELSGWRRAILLQQLYAASR